MSGAVVAALVVLVPAAPASAATLGAPFTCTSATDFLSASAGNGSTEVLAATEAAGPSVHNLYHPLTANSFEPGFNSLGFDPVSNYLYATGIASATNTHLIEADSTGATVDLGPVAALPTPGSPEDFYDVGAFDPAGNFWITETEANVAYEINVSATPLTATVYHFSDRAWVPEDWTYSFGFFWGLAGTTLYRFDPATSSVATFPITEGTDLGYVGAWTFSNGDLGFQSNATNGPVVRLSVTNPASTSPTFTNVTTYDSGVVGDGGGDATSCGQSLAISPTSFPDGLVGQPYSAGLSATGGPTPAAYSWTVTGGALPGGLSLDPSSGAITGTPTTPGSSSFTVQVTANGGFPQTASRTYTLGIDAPLTTSNNLSDGAYGQPYSATLAASSGTPPYTWSITAGSLPSGLTLDPNSGTISGTPTTAGPSTFTVSVSDTGNPVQNASQQLTLTVDPAALTANISGAQTYGGTPTFTVAGYTGFVNGDTASAVSGTLTGCTTSQTASTPPGHYSGTITGCSGLSSANYTINYDDAGYTVNPAALTITASSGSMVYESVVPAITAGYAGFVNGDSATSLATSPACSTTATSTSPVGVYPTKCTGAADPDYNIGYAGGSLSIAAASTTISYTGPQSASSNSTIVPTATLLSSAPGCQASQSVAFTLDVNPTNGGAGPYSLESATTSGAGLATGASISTTGWQGGAYNVTVTYAGNGNCITSTTSSGLAVSTPGLAAVGAGSYVVPAAGAVNFGFVVALVPHTTGTYIGSIDLVNSGKWWLKGNLTSYSKTSSTQGAAKGSGSLYWWNPTLNRGHGAWQLATTSVLYTVTFTAPTKTAPGSFGIQITYAPTAPQPTALPNSVPINLKPGLIALN